MHRLQPLEARRMLSAGDPDPTFGVGGRAEGPRQPWVAPPFQKFPVRN